MSLASLYQETIVDHARHPRNFRKTDPETHRADGYNPLCGDCISVSLRVADGRILDSAFQGAGCAISTASASLMTEEVVGKTIVEAEELFRQFREAMTSDEYLEDMGRLEALRAVKEYPMRVKCATLAWHALHAALQGSAKSATTE